MEFNFFIYVTGQPVAVFYLSSDLCQMMFNSLV